MLHVTPDAPSSLSTLSTENGPDSHLHLQEISYFVFELEEVFLSESIPSTDDLHNSPQWIDLLGYPLLQGEQPGPDRVGCSATPSYGSCLEWILGTQYLDLPWSRSFYVHLLKPWLEAESVPCLRILIASSRVISTDCFISTMPKSKSQPLPTQLLAVSYANQTSAHWILEMSR